MELASLKNGRFSTQALSPQMMRLVSGGKTFDTDHFESGKQDYGNYSRCGAKEEYYDMKITYTDGSPIMEGIGSTIWKGTEEWWYDK